MKKIFIHRETLLGNWSISVPAGNKQETSVSVHIYFFCTGFWSVFKLTYLKDLTCLEEAAQLRSYMWKCGCCIICRKRNRNSLFSYQLISPHQMTSDCTTYRSVNCKLHYKELLVIKIFGSNYLITWIDASRYINLFLWYQTKLLHQKTGSD